MIKMSTAEAKQLMRSICQTDKAWNLANRSFTNKEWEVFPGVVNTDPRLLQFLENLSKDLKSLSWGKINEDGVFEGAPLDRDPMDLKTVPGLKRFPLDFGIVDDISYLEDNDKPDQNFLRILKELMSITHEKRLRTYGRFSRGSNIGFPYGSSDAFVKQVATKKALNNLDEILTAWKTRDLSFLNEKYGILFLTHTQIRTQIDKYGKQREIFRFGSEKGDASINPDKYVKGFSRMRTRTVCAYANVLNYVFTSVCDGLRTFREHRFSKTWKHRGPQDILKKISEVLSNSSLGDRIICTMDFGTYDRSVKHWMIRGYIDNLPINETLKEMMWYQFLCPRYCSDDGEQRYLLEANPLDISHIRWFRGITSGIWCTSDLGKTIAIALQIWALYEMGYASLGPSNTMRNFITEYLDHKFGVASLNMGDDNVFVGDRRMISQIISFLKEKGFDVQLEKGAKFIGNNFFYDGGLLRSTLGMVAYLIGCWIPERAWNDNNFRPYGIWGLKQRRSLELFGGHPLFNEVRGMEKKRFNEVFGLDLDEIERIYLKIPQHITGIRNVESEVNLTELLAKPEILHFKIDENDVPEEILDMIYYKLDEDFVEDKIQNLNMAEIY